VRRALAVRLSAHQPGGAQVLDSGPHAREPQSDSAWKFAFAATGSLLIAETLILSSDLLIGLPAEGIALHALAMAVIALGLSAINVGLGAYLPNFKETDPSKIVVGFGGTVNMVVGLIVPGVHCWTHGRAVHVAQRRGNPQRK